MRDYYGKIIGDVAEIPVRRLRVGDRIKIIDMHSYDEMKPFLNVEGTVTNVDARGSFNLMCNRFILEWKNEGKTEKGGVIYEADRFLFRSFENS